MSRPRRRLFGPLFYSTLVLTLLVAIYDVVLNAPQWFESASKALGERRAVRSLADSLRAADPASRESAARRLMAMGPDLYKPIMRDAAGDPRGEVRALAYRLLVEGWSEPSEVVPMLTAAAGDGEELVRLEAARGLGRLAQGGRIRAGSGSLPGAPAPAQRDNVLRTLRRLLKDSSSLVRAEAAGPLALFGPDPVIAGDLAAAVNDDDRTVRLAAAQALLKVNGPDDPAAARALVAMVASPDAVPDRQEVLRVIRTMGDAVQDRAVAALVDLLSRADPDILPDVIASLPEAGPRAKPAVPALEALLEHAEPGLRAGAAMAILAIESPEDFRALQASAPGGMGMATMSGMSGGGLMVMGPIAGAGATDPAAEVHANPRVVAILARIVGDAAIVPESRQNALGMIRMAGASAVAKTSSELVRQLADPDPNVRRTAVELLSQIIDVAPASLPAASGAK